MSADEKLLSLDLPVGRNGLLDLLPAFLNAVQGDDDLRDHDAFDAPILHGCIGEVCQAEVVSAHDLYSPKSGRECIYYRKRFYEPHFPKPFRALGCWPSLQGRSSAVAHNESRLSSGIHHKLNVYVVAAYIAKEKVQPKVHALNPREVRA